MKYMKNQLFNTYEKVYALYMTRDVCIGLKSLCINGMGLLINAGRGGVDVGRRGSDSKYGNRSLLPHTGLKQFDLFIMFHYLKSDLHICTI